MEQTEFDRFADEYRAAHARNIRLSGEGPEYFAEYKVVELKRELGESASKVTRLLDFGGGVGNSVPHFNKHLPAAQLVVADVSSRSLEIAAERFPDSATYSQIREARIPADDASFDVAFAACVLHHIDHREHLHWLCELKRVVVPGGLIAIFEHNPWNPLTMHAVSTCPFDVNARCISMAAMRGQMRQAGLDVVSARYTFFFPAPLKVLRPLEKYMGWLPAGGQYVLFARH